MEFPVLRSRISENWFVTDGGVRPVEAAKFKVFLTERTSISVDYLASSTLSPKRSISSLLC